MEKWLKNLNLWLWHYLPPCKFRGGYHLAADLSAADAILRCIDLLRGNSEYDTVRTIPSRPVPEDLHEYFTSTSFPFETFASLRLKHCIRMESVGQVLPSASEPDVFEIAFDAVGAIRLKESIGEFRTLRDGFVYLSVNADEDVKGNSDRQLWLWVPVNND